MLYDIIMEAARIVSVSYLLLRFHQWFVHQVPSAYDSSGTTIYDKWMRVNRNNETNEPKYVSDDRAIEIPHGCIV